jgi:alpha-L-rhamnosidase
MPACHAELNVTDLRCEYRTNPLGIDNVNPRLSWKLDDPGQQRGQEQVAYQILVASTLQKLKQEVGDVWSSSVIQDSDSVNRVFQGNRLVSGQQCYWKVRVRDAAGQMSDWSEPAKFTIGLIKPEDWKGQWISKADQQKTDHNWYRKTFKLEQDPQSALVYVASYGYHELYVNGEKVTDNVMNPALSYMKKRIPYLTYDVAPYLNEGDNVIAVWHAAGWTRWRGIREYRNIPFVFKAQVEIKDGDDRLSFGSDTTWKCKKSHSEYFGDWDILRFGGETIDDRLKEDDWNTAAYDDSDWMNASVYSAAELNAKIPEGDNISFALNGSKNRTLPAEYSEIRAELSAQRVEPQVRFRELKPIEVKDNHDGTYRIDMGENYTGFFEMNLYHGSEGDSVFFEISDQTEVVMNWKQKSQYIYGPSGSGRFTNRFNVAGGRWITVYGLSYQPNLEDITGYVVTNDRKQISQFESSSELLNKIYKINLDTYLANTMDGILVDCPHRERRGWGEVTVAAMYGDALPNFESGAYMDQYAQFMRDAQYNDGQIRAVINEEDRPFLMWKANSPITIWETYKMLGDKKLLRDNYESMQKWMLWMHNASNYETGGALKIGERGQRQMPGLGDWCTPRGSFWDSSNSPDAAHFNNCTYAYMLGCAMKMAEALGESDDAKAFADRLEVQQKATHEQSYDPATGQYLDGKQVDQAFALLAGVTPAEERQKVSAQLADNVLYAFPYYDTGSSGQALYSRFFAEYGERMDLVYELLKDKSHPSYGYFIEQGKTVWPERWSAVGNSQIHTCYTGIGAYFIKGFGGIRPDPDDLGMRNFLIKPAPVGDLTFANTEFDSMYGNIVVNWKREGGSASYHIEVPTNCTAKVYLPALGKEDVAESGKPAEDATGIEYLGTEKNAAVGNYVVYRVASGVYDFKVHAVPTVTCPDPIYQGSNLSKIGRMNASSMFIENEKLPGFEAFKANDEDPETCWQAGEAKDQWLEVEWVKPQTFSKVRISEVGEHIASYRVQSWTGAEWTDLARGGTCGAEKTETFQPVHSTKCRLMIDKSSSPPSIAEFEVIRASES